MKLFLIAISLLFCLHPGLAQVSPTPTFLWMVLSKENKTPSFIFGTVHHLGPRPVLDNKDLMRIILQSRIIVQEADTNELLHVKDSNFDITSDTALDVLLGYADYQFVKNEFYQATDENLEDFKHLMPQVIMQMIDDGFKRKQNVQEKQPLMENAFYALSIVKKIPITGLETRKDNFEIMYKMMPLHEQADLLMYDLKNLKFDDGAEVMRDCFANQDLSCLCAVGDISSYKRPGDKYILLARNLFWMPAIENHISEGNAFIAVGAAHLCGSMGIISMLKRKGYQIAPILTK